jgi:hypothetical protein
MTTPDLGILARVMAEVVEITGDDVFLTLGAVDTGIGAHELFRASLSCKVWGGGMVPLYDPIEGETPMAATAATPAGALAALAALLARLA